MDQPVVTTQTKKCPACAETVLAEAIKCKHCGERLDKPRAGGDVQSRFKAALGPVLRGGLVVTLKLSLLCAVSGALITGFAIGAWKQQLGGDVELARFVSSIDAGMYGFMALALCVVMILGMVLFILVLATLGLRRPEEEYLKGAAVAGVLASMPLVFLRGSARLELAFLIAGSCVAIFAAAGAPPGRPQQVRAALSGAVFGLAFLFMLGRSDLLPPKAQSSWSDSQQWIFFGLTVVTLALLIFVPAALLGLRLLREQVDRANAS